MMIAGMHYSPTCNCDNCERITKSNKSNNPMSIKTIEEEFDKFWHDMGIVGTKLDRERIKQFYSQKIKEMTEEMKIKKRITKNIVERDYCNKEIGYNKAVDEINNKIDNLNK